MNQNITQVLFVDIRIIYIAFFSCHEMIVKIFFYCLFVCLFVCLFFFLVSETDV